MNINIARGLKWLPNVKTFIVVLLINILLQRTFAGNIIQLSSRGLIKSGLIVKNVFKNTHRSRPCHF